MLFIKKVPEEENEAIVAMLKKLGVNKPVALKRGEVKLENMSARRIKKIEELLTKNGFSLVTKKKEILSEKIKMIIEDMLAQEHMPVVNFSVHISQQLDHNYTYLSDLFSELNEITIEHYIINSRVEEAKRLMRETDAFVGEIARKLHYKNITHMSAQFKKITGLTPSEYKKKASCEIQGQGR